MARLGTRDTGAYALWTGKGHYIQVITSDGVIQFAWTAAIDPEVKRFSKNGGFEFEVVETATAPLLPRPFHLQREELITSHQQTLLDLSHWLIFLTYTLLWLTVTIAWHRRKHRLARGTIAQRVIHLHEIQRLRVDELHHLGMLAAARGGDADVANHTLALELVQIELALAELARVHARAASHQAVRVELLWILE